MKKDREKRKMYFFKNWKINFMLYLDNPQEKSRVAYPQMGGGYTKKTK